MLDILSQPCVMQSLHLHYTCAPALPLKRSSIQSYAEYLEGSQSPLIVYGSADEHAVILIISLHSWTPCTLLNFPQRFIMKHLQNIDYILTDLKCAELILAALKLMFCFLKMKFIRFIYNENERHSDSKKIAKII